MARRKKETEAEETAVSRRVLVMDDGETHEITGEEGKYYLCGWSRFRKGNPHIVSVEIGPAAE